MGLVQVYTGDGKGKTTAALGQAVRAAGRGFRVQIFQFMKPGHSNGEQYSAPYFGEKLTIIPIGRPNWVRRDRPAAVDVRLARAGLTAAHKTMTSGQVDMLVLDEICPAVHYQLLSLADVLKLIERRPPEVELILTGRSAAKEILEKADLITEMALRRHPYNHGVPARLGIEF